MTNRPESPIWLRKSDGSGELAGSLPLEYVVGPNVDLPEGLNLEAPEAEINPGHPPVFDSADGFSGEDLEALQRTAAEIFENAMCATRRAFILGGVAAIGVAAISGAQPASAAPAVPTSISTPATIQAAPAAATVAKAKTKACAKAQKKLVAAKKTGKKTAVKSAKRVVAKKCVTAAAIGGEGATWNADGTINSPEETPPTNTTPSTPSFVGLTVKETARLESLRFDESPKAQAEYASLARKAFAPGTPEAVVEASINERTADVHSMYTNAQAGDIISNGCLRVLVPITWDIVGKGVLGVMTVQRTDIDQAPRLDYMGVTANNRISSTSTDPGRLTPLNLRPNPEGGLIQGGLGGDTAF